MNFINLVKNKRRTAVLMVFVRRLALPDGVNTEKVQAAYKDGMLEITMPMEKTVGGRKVLIAGAEEGKKEREIH